ncbi:DUF885 domain-containing protein [Colwellia hornerae]|uniref:DUF885 domain-containing protein n=1 Tax=Colwellia hornerae TaxID=89402 RepID=A0A5C6QPZ9_9GAMM|nr:DUF885 domain-containing protein [Colwellia hornerae]TWX55704.1 DUF885 domain-containing protein [Colwellia hornerae]TWX61914.1 DUF885 domain-containing protein [Colwellia hornerae]TWX71246.1 DUF885 domain-containing protein [Colwellia hornerae]
MTLKNTLLLVVISSSLLAACSAQKTTTTAKKVLNEVEKTIVVNAMSESEKANQLFDTIFDEDVSRSPMTQTYLGIKTDYDKWDDISEENNTKELSITKINLQRVKAIDSTKLDEQTLISYHLLVQKLENKISDHKWRFHNYPVNQMFGLHSRVPAFLINQHSIKNIKEAQDYIARVQGANSLLEQLTTQLKLREQLGIMAPKFVYPHVIRDSKNILQGAPFSEGEDSTILADFTKKVDKLAISVDEKNVLMADVKVALITSIKPGYEQLVSYLKVLEKKADDKDGAWKFPQGKAFFNNALQRTTTTDLTADQIHQIGLSEVDRIHSEMRVIMEKVGFKGELADFFEFMRTDKQFYYPADAAGKQRYLNEAVALIEDMKDRLDSLFLTKPKAELTVKAVEAFREKSAGKAFYQQPAPDGSRPGIYYANLYDMKAMPIYQMAALAYHEGIPGHHMQIAIKQELTNIPKFRKFGGYTAHTEGWGLYAEMLPKEIGLYQDPYSDFGRLAMELWRACRLVVDTGIHSKKWTRAQGIGYYVNNTPNAKSDAVKMVERHVVMPSQATAYKIGMLKIIELREQAKVELGDKFDIREFHDVVLRNGPVPLNVLAQLVNSYIANKKA